MAPWPGGRDGARSFADLDSACCDMATVRALLNGVDPVATRGVLAASLGGKAALEVPTKPARWAAEVDGDGDAHDLDEGVAPLATAPSAGLRDAEAFVAKVTVSKCSTPTKLRCDVLHGGALRINDLPEEGAFAQYNLGAAPAPQIRQGDCIVAVGGSQVSGAALAEGGLLELRVLRPHRFAICVQRGQGTLGLEVVYSEHSTALYVSAVSPGGAVQGHGARSAALAVRPGDFIVAVNAVGL